MYISKETTKAGFTLIEMLVVLAVITLLFGLLIAPIKAVRENARYSMALSETKAMETAWKEFFSKYHHWPTNSIKNGLLIIDNEAPAYLTDMLQGQRIEDGDTVYNPKRIQFIEFTRFDGEGTPANPWIDDDDDANPHYAYFTKFDLDYDNVIEFGGTNIRRSVIVFTTNAVTDKVIGSWHQ